MVTEEGFCLMWSKRICTVVVCCAYSLSRLARIPATAECFEADMILIRSRGEQQALAQICRQLPSPAAQVLVLTRCITC